MFMPFSYFYSINFFNCIVNCSTNLAVTTANRINNFTINKCMCFFISIFFGRFSYNIAKRKFFPTFYDCTTNSRRCYFNIIYSVFIIIKYWSEKTANFRFYRSFVISIRNIIIYIINSCRYLTCTIVFIFLNT